MLIDTINLALSNLEFPKTNVIVEYPKNPEHGDFSTNTAMLLAKPLGKSPRVIAEEIVAELQHMDSNAFESISIAGPGFINFTLNKNTVVQQLLDIVNQGSNFGKQTTANGLKVLVEFVSANPTGPLTIGHGRGAMLGDTVSNILEWNGYNVQREYYFNNAGRQMRVLGESVRARYLELQNLDFDFPEGGYEGEYIRDIAQNIIDTHSDALANELKSPVFKDTAESIIFDDIKSTLARLGLVFDSFFNEHTLYENNEIYKVIEELRDKGLIYEKDDATWFKGTAVGREADRVLIKSTGEPTYRLPDMAYHRTKFERGFDEIVDVFGADHMDAYPDVLEVLNQLGYASDKVNVLIHQFVTILKDGKPVKMSTRKANFITLDELIDEVGADVVRYFFIMRGMNSHLNFDLDLAKNQSDENPVFYLQYAHARTCNIIKRGEAFGHALNKEADLSLLTSEYEHQLIQKLALFPEIIKRSAHTLEPQTIANYLHELSGVFHRYYANERVIIDDKQLTEARLVLVEGSRIVLANGLRILGISAPERM